MFCVSSFHPKTNILNCYNFLTWLSNGNENGDVELKLNTHFLSSSVFLFFPCVSFFAYKIFTFFCHLMSFHSATALTTRLHISPNCLPLFLAFASSPHNVPIVPSVVLQKAKRKFCSTELTQTFTEKLSFYNVLFNNVHTTSISAPAYTVKHLEHTERAQDKAWIGSWE